MLLTRKLVCLTLVLLLFLTAAVYGSSITDEAEAIAAAAKETPGKLKRHTTSWGKGSVLGGAAGVASSLGNPLAGAIGAGGGAMHGAAAAKRAKKGKKTSKVHCVIC